MTNSVFRLIFICFSGCLDDRRAVTALEYALIAGFIAAVIVGAVTTLGTHLNTAYHSAQF